MQTGLALLFAMSLPGAAVAQAGECVSVDVTASASGPMQFSMAVVEGRAILIGRGEIAAGTADRFTATYRTADRVDEIRLESPGGDVAEALRLGRALRASRAPVRVAAGGHCAGACADAFLGGIQRSIDPGAWIGFGGLPPTPEAGDRPPAAREQAAARWAEERADYYIRMGVSRGLLRLQLSSEVPTFCYLSAAAVRRYNVANDAVTLGTRR